MRHRKQWHPAYRRMNVWASQKHAHRLAYNAKETWHSRGTRGDPERLRSCSGLVLTRCSTVIVQLIGNLPRTPTSSGGTARSTSETTASTMVGRPLAVAYESALHPRVSVAVMRPASCLPVRGRIGSGSTTHRQRYCI